VAEAGGGDDRGVHDADAVVGLELVADAAEDRDRVLDAGLVDHHRLEAALERLVLLDVLAVLVEGGRADAAQLAAGEGRLEHVGGVLGALGLAGADEGVELVDEEDDLAVGGLDLLEHGLEALLEFAAVLGAGDQGGEVELHELAVLEALGDVAGGDAQGDALGDRGLADAGVADQHGVVLGAAREDLDRAADLDVAADHRVELALAGGLGEVAAVLGERLVLVLGVLVLDGLGAADLGERREQQVAAAAELAEDLGGADLLLERLGLSAARIRCSLLTKRSCSASASPAARSSSSRSSRGARVAALTRGWRASSALTARSTAAPWTPVRSSSGTRGRPPAAARP
jgi:hypothetical protein